MDEKNPQISRTVILLDYDKFVEAKALLGIDELNLAGFLAGLNELHSDSQTQTVYAYVGIDEKQLHRKDPVIDELWRNGCVVRTVRGEHYGVHFVADCSQSIAMDALRSVYENGVTTVALVSNSRSLENLVVALREKDVWVETFFFGSLMDYDLAVKSSRFIDLEPFIKDEDETGEDGNVPEDESSDASDSETCEALRGNIALDEEKDCTEEPDVEDLGAEETIAGEKQTEMPEQSFSDSNDTKAEGEKQ